MVSLRYLLGQPLVPLEVLLARAPLVLQGLVERVAVDVLGPPLAPAGEEDALRVLGEVVPEEGAQDVGAACLFGC